MSFSVDPGALAGYAAQLGRAQEDAVQCHQYFEREVPETTWHGDGGVFSPIYFEHNHVRETVGAVLTHMISLLDSAQAELSKAATYYATTDHRAASRMDSTIPQTIRPPASRD